MDDYQFRRICERLDKIIKLLEALQSPSLVCEPRWTIVPDPGFILDPSWPGSTWAPNINTTTVENDR